MLPKIGEETMVSWLIFYYKIGRVFNLIFGFCSSVLHISPYAIHFYYYNVVIFEKSPGWNETDTIPFIFFSFIVFLFFSQQFLLSAWYNGFNNKEGWKWRSLLSIHWKVACLHFRSGSGHRKVFRSYTLKPMWLFAHSQTVVKERSKH